MINSWHNWLNMTKYGKKWHENDLQDELNEYYEEKKLIKKWSELSDVVYTSTRGQYSGHDIKFPFSKWRLYLGLIYTQNIPEDGYFLGMQGVKPDL